MNKRISNIESIGGKTNIIIGLYLSSSLWRARTKRLLKKKKKRRKKIKMKEKVSLIKEPRPLK